MDAFNTTRKPAEFFARLRLRLEEKGVLWDELPHVSDIDTPPPCFVYRAGGDKEAALKLWHAWLLAALDTTDITDQYRYEQPRDPNFCVDCTPAFRGEALNAGACSFHILRFETREFLGERDMVGVSHAPMVPPTDPYMLDDMVIPRAALPRAIQARLNELEGKPKKLKVKLKRKPATP